MEKLTLALVATIIFGRLIPIILVAVLVVGLALIIKEAAEHEI